MMRKRTAQTARLNITRTRPMAASIPQNDTLKITRPMVEDSHQWRGLHRQKVRQLPATISPNKTGEQKIYRINGVDYTDKNRKAAAAASKAIFG